MPQGIAIQIEKEMYSWPAKRNRKEPVKAVKRIRRLEVEVAV